MRLCRIEVNRRRLRRLTVGICQTRVERARGLLFRRWSSSTALLLQACNAVHTWGMDQPLDLLFCDQEDRIIHMVCGLQPWRFARRSAAHSVWEFRAGAINELGLRCGDRIRPC
jgi:uncharacterized membrane protein (UPF0127 family)